MDAIELKSDLHNLIDKVNDTSILMTIRNILSKQTEESDWYDQLSESERKLIDQGLAEADSGDLIPHQEVMREVKAKYNFD